MAHKQTGNIFPLIVTDIYGVIINDTELDMAYLNLLRTLSYERRVVAFSSMGKDYIARLARKKELDFISNFYSASGNEWPKYDAMSYRKLADYEGVDVSDIVLIDDSTQNIDACNLSGATGLLHISAGETEANLRNLGVLE